MTTYNAAAWLVDRHVAAGARRPHRLPRRRRGRRTTRRCSARCSAPSTRLRALDVRRGERVALVLDDELAFPAWFLGALRSGVVPVPLSTMLTAGELAAIVADAGAGVVVLSPGYAGYVDALAAADAELRHAVVVGDPAGGAAVPAHAWSSFTDDAEAPVAPTTAGLAGVLAVQLGHDRRARRA